MMRVSREEDHSIGRARPGMVIRAKIGFRKDGRITAMDLFIVQDGGPFTRAGDYAQIATVASANYTPLTMRFRGTAVLTNTPPRGPQRGPGGEQSMTLLEPLISKAARQLGIDDVEIRKINAPITGSAFGPPNGRRSAAAHGRVRARGARQGAALFKWDERKARNGAAWQQGYRGRRRPLAFSAGTIGSTAADVRPDGKLAISRASGTWDALRVRHARVAAKRSTCRGRVRSHWGSSGRTCRGARGRGKPDLARELAGQPAAGMDAKRKLQEIAAKDLGGTRRLRDRQRRVFRKETPAAA
jgi:xanthine dehydrogenase molybdenum-binding subunit